MLTQAVRNPGFHEADAFGRTRIWADETSRLEDGYGTGIALRTLATITLWIATLQFHAARIYLAL